MILLMTIESQPFRKGYCEIERVPEAYKIRIV